MKHDAEGITRTRRTITVHRPPREVYDVWRNPQEFARILDRRVSLEMITPAKSHWSVRAPGHAFEWDAEISADEPGRRIAWTSLPDSEVANSGAVHFEARDDGGATDVTLEFDVQSPRGLLATLTSTVLRQALEFEAGEMLARLKARLEGVAK
jgi:uncharacterized membrane protein